MASGFQDKTNKLKPKIKPACTTQYELIVVNGQTTTSEFHKVA